MLVYSALCHVKTEDMKTLNSRYLLYNVQSHVVQLLLLWFMCHASAQIFQIQNYVESITM